MEEKIPLKPTKVIGKLFKIFISVLIVCIYLFFFVRFFVSCDSDIIEKVYLSQEMVNMYNDRTSDFSVLLYEPVSWTNDDASLQLKNIIYMPKAKNLHIAVKYNMDKLFSESEPTRFVLRKTTGEGSGTVETSYEISICEKEQRYNYMYLRLCFSGIDIYDGEIVETDVEKYDEQLGISYVEKVESIEGGDKVYLDIYNSNDELLYTFTVAGRKVGGREISRDKVDVVVK